MDVNNVNRITNYFYNNTMFNTLYNSSSNTKVPQVKQVDGDQKNNTDNLRYQKISNEQKSKDILNNIQLKLSNPVNLNISNDPNLFSQINGGPLQINNKALDVYTSIQNGTFKPSSTSITTSNPYSLYTNVNSMMNQLQSTGSLFNAVA